MDYIIIRGHVYTSNLQTHFKTCIQCNIWFVFNCLHFDRYCYIIYRSALK